MKVSINKKKRGSARRAGSARTPRTTIQLLPRGKKARRELKLLSGASVSMLTVVIVLMFAASGAAPRYAMRFPQVAAVVSAVIVDLTNGDRTTNDLSILKVNPVLVAAAQTKADDMAAKGYFAHTSPDGTDPWHWFAEAGYQFDYAGENLAIDFSDSADVERAWMNSPTHRENILNTQFTEIGIATAVGMYQGRMTTFVVQEFGTPKGTSRKHVATAIVPTDPSEPAIASAPAGPQSAQVLGTSAGEPKAASAVVAQNATRRDVEAVAPTTAIDPASVVAQVPQKPPLWAYMIGVPHAALQYSYYFLGLLVLVALAYTTRLEMHRHHIRHATSAGYLLGLMGFLLLIAHFTIFAEPVLAAVIASH